MHEVGIMQAALEQAIASAQADQATRIHVIRLRVGALSGVVPEALEFAFTVVRAGTMAAEAILEIESVPMRCWCPRCADEFTGDGLSTLCPRCHSPSPDIRAGRELEVASLEVS